MRPMVRSLRFQLPLIFLVGFVVAALVATAISVRFFQSYTRARAIDELRGESGGIVKLFEQQASLTLPKSITVGSLKRAIGGDSIFFVPRPRFPFLKGMPALPATTVSAEEVERRGSVTFEFTYRAAGRKPVRMLGVAKPLELLPSSGTKVSHQTTWGSIVVAKPTSKLRSSLLTLLGQLALALAGGLVVATLLSVYLSRRISKPLAVLSDAADEVAAGRRDVTVPDVPGANEIAHLAERFREMASRLAEAEELERNFLMSVSHELRTPLTAIQGHVAALREGVFSDPEMRDMSLQVISQEAERLGRLVGDVLDLAKLDAHRFTVLHEEVEMERVVEQAAAAFGEEARRRSIDLRQEIHARPVVVTDGDRVLQIITNLLSNALRWTPEGGSIELMLGAANGHVEVDVRDTGPGIGPDEKERIFRPFWSRDGGGTGLGLAIARELALALGGRIELETAPGRGSTFKLVLPSSTGDAVRGG
jgi:two-component system sensor histidine kinase BaeS